MRGSNRLEKVAEMDLPIQAGPIRPVPIEGHLLASDLDHIVTHRSYRRPQPAGCQRRATGIHAEMAASPSRSVRWCRRRDSRLIQDPQYSGWKIVQQFS